MRIPSTKLGADTLATIPNLLLHPAIAKHGITRYTLDSWRTATPPKLWTANTSGGETQAIYKSTLRHLLRALKANLNLDVKADQLLLEIDPNEEETTAD